MGFWDGMVRWGGWLGMALLAGVAWWMARQAQWQSGARRRERRLREELEAYAHLDATLAGGRVGRGEQGAAAKGLAARVCRAVAEKSAFPRVMLLLRNAEGRLRCVGSIGVDDLTVTAVERWAEAVAAQELGGQDAELMREARGVESASPLQGGAGARTVAISLGEWNEFDPGVATSKLEGHSERRRWRRALVLPIRTGSRNGRGHGFGQLAGAIVVCSDGLAVPARDAAGGVRLDRLMSPLETLAARLGAAMENEALALRLLRAEKLAGLGQLAGGVAHALNNPLTAVLGFAELIAESSEEPRVQRDARTIAAEALKMKATIERLQDFWRPSTQADEPVDVLEMVRELADGCAGTLAARGVKLEVIAPAGLELVRGSRERLAQVFEHVMNNAAQAIAKARAREDGEEHAIRISMSQDERTLYVIVSDTGTGFQDPGRAFDPFYTTRTPVAGAGLGLSICYGIIREHGGEIAAFNLHPHGAAVVVELPLKVAILGESRVMVEDRVGV